MFLLGPYCIVCLVIIGSSTHFTSMPPRAPKPYRKSQFARMATLALGIVLVVISPIIGALPGPGFIIVFPIGLALILKSSRTAKRMYARFKHRHPKYGVWSDRALRRRKSRSKPLAEKAMDAGDP